MNTTINDDSLMDARFDRLVDDELSERERRELLAGLDNEPGGWRRCALAFLESQCWKKAVRTPARHEEKAAPNRIAAPKPLESHRPRWRSHLGTLAAMAASFLIMFYAASLLLRTETEQPANSTGITGEVAVNTHANPTKPWQMVTVPSPTENGDKGQALHLPAVEREKVDPQWLNKLPPAVPDDVMQAFHRTGHQIEQQRELVPVPLKDGRQLVVPVDQVNVRYVGNGPY